MSEDFNTEEECSRCPVLADLVGAPGWQWIFWLSTWWWCCRFVSDWTFTVRRHAMSVSCCLFTLDHMATKGWNWVKFIPLVKLQNVNSRIMWIGKRQHIDKMASSKWVKCQFQAIYPFKTPYWHATHGHPAPYISRCIIYTVSLKEESRRGSKASKHHRLKSAPSRSSHVRELKLGLETGWGH